MFESVIHPDGAMADNSREGLACPPWLFLLDRVDPGRVLCVGPADAVAARWFADQGIVVREVAPAAVLAGDPVESGAYDLVWVTQAGARVLARDDSVARLRQASTLRGELWSVTGGGPEVEDRLRRAGYASVRWVIPTSESTDPGDGIDATPAGAIRYLPSSGSSKRPRLPRFNRSGVNQRMGLVAGVQVRDNRPPAYAHDLAVRAGLDLSEHRWALWSRGDYPSQKAVMYLLPAGEAQPDAVVKVTRHPRFNSRLDNEHLMLSRVEAVGGPSAARAPKPRFHGSAGPLRVVGESAFNGTPFLSISSLDAHCRLAADAAEGITELGRATARPVTGAAVGGPLQEVLGRFRRLFGPSAEADRELQRHVDRIGAEPELPAVLFHGDLGTWNMMVADGAVRFLDWESAEEVGPPLWDLAYFIRSYAVQSGRRRGQSRSRAISRHLVGASDVTEAAGRWIEGYRRTLGLAPELVAPLFHTCWMHRAVKESGRLAKGSRGHYAELCLRLVVEHDAPGLRTLVGESSRA